jgi:ribosomal protein L16 Arg81 hydroxylase
MVSAGATVCVTGLESAHPKVQRHLETIKRELNFPGRLSLRAYASPPGSGFDLHYDACAVTTLHLAGEKEWWYSEKPVVRFPERNSPNESLAPNSAFRSVRLKRVVMAPGDLLALPPGALHRARAKTVCLALNLAFEYLGARYVDLVQQESGRRASRSEELRRPLPRLSPAEGRRPAAEFKRQTQKTIDCLIAGLVEMRESDEWVPRALRALYE